MSTLRRSVEVLGAAITVTSLTVASAAPAFAATKQPDVAEAIAINNQNVAVGDALNTEDQFRAVVWSPSGSITDLGTLAGGDSSVATGINNRGEIVGTSTAGDSEVGVAVRWSPTGQICALQSLASEPGSSSFPKAVNDAGFVIGFVSMPPDYHDLPVLWRPDGSIIELDQLTGFTDSQPLAINNSGVGVGYEYSAIGPVQAVRWDTNGKVTPLAVPPGDNDTFAYDINNRGDIIGDGIDRPNQRYQVLEWDPAGQVHVIATDTGPVTGQSINDHGVSVGEDQFAATAWYPDGRKISLAIPPNTDAPIANAINDRDVAVGRGVFISEVAMRWSPDGSVTVLPGLGYPGN